MPALLALLLQIAQLLPLPVVVRIALPSYAFIAWRGLFTDPAQTGPFSSASPSASPGRWPPPRWPTGSSCAATSPTWPTTGSAAAFSLRAVLPLAALLAVTVAVIAGATSASGSGIDKAKLDRSLATAFAHLYRMQTGELHRPDVTEAQLRTSAACDKGGSRVDDLDRATTGGVS